MKIIYNSPKLPLHALILLFFAIGACVFGLSATKSATPTAKTTSISLLQQGKYMTESPRDSFDSRLGEYMAETNYAHQRAIAESGATAQHDLLICCARKMRVAVDPAERLAISHFATAYYQLGGKQDELFQMIQSDDVELVAGLLSLLCDAVEIDANGTWEIDRPLGGPTMPYRVAQVATAHPGLSASVVSTLAVYGQSQYKIQTRKELRTVLQMLLSQDRSVSISAYFAILMIDDTLCAQFGLGPEPITEQQRIAVADFIKSLD